jgi:A/G-specific adenine glycosylase
MLQQTGIARVLEPYKKFLHAFPSFRALAEAQSSAVLSCWQGLGYNRRALALQQSARIVTDRYNGRLPRTRDELCALPGVGTATAGAVLVYAFGLPVPFIETNVRRVFIHFFFPGAVRVPDEQIMPLVEQTMDRLRPRDWFYALMDYGTMLGRGGDNANRRSAVYKRQAPFEGSRRQLRGRVIAHLVASGTATRRGLERAIGGPDPRLDEVLRGLASEGFLQKRSDRFSLK